MRPLCHTPALGTPMCTSGAFCGVVRPAYAQVRRRSPVPARITPRRPFTGVWSMDLALRIFKHHTVITGQNVFMAACGPCWSVIHGPEKSKVYQCIQCCFSSLVCVRELSFARMRARMCVYARTRVSTFFSLLSFRPRTSYKKIHKVLILNGFKIISIADHSQTGTDQGDA